MAPMGSQVLIDHGPASVIRPLSPSEYSPEYVMRARKARFTLQELQPYNNINK